MSLIQENETLFKTPTKMKNSVAKNAPGAPTFRDRSDAITSQSDAFHETFSRYPILTINTDNDESIVSDPGDENNGKGGESESGGIQDFPPTPPTIMRQRRIMPRSKSTAHLPIYNKFENIDLDGLNEEMKRDMKTCIPTNKHKRRMTLHEVYRALRANLKLSDVASDLFLIILFVYQWPGYIAALVIIGYRLFDIVGLCRNYEEPVVLK